MLRARSPNGWMRRRLPVPRAMGSPPRPSTAAISAPRWEPSRERRSGRGRRAAQRSSTRSSSSSRPPLRTDACGPPRNWRRRPGRTRSIACGGAWRLTGCSRSPRTTRSSASPRAPSRRRSARRGRLPPQKEPGRWTMSSRENHVAEVRMIEAVRAAITEEMERDERVLVMGEDVGRKGGVFGATDGLYARFGEARVLDPPLAESGIVGVAIGAALNGLIPIAEIQFADFIHPAFDQIVSEAARTRYRSNGDWSVPMVIRTPFGGGVHGGLYHSQSIEAFYAHVPGLKVVIPSTPADAHGLLKSAIRDPDPVLFLEHKKIYRLVAEEVPDGDHLVPIGPAVVRREGTNISCFAWGLMTHYCLQAAEQLAADGVSVEVVDLRSLAPLDRDTILQSVRKTGKAIIVHEDNITGGFGAEIAAIISEHAFDSLDGPVVRVAGPDIPAMPFNNPQEDFFMPNPTKIAEAMKKLAAY